MMQKPTNKVRKPRSLEGRAAQEVSNLKQLLSKTTDPIEVKRLHEVIALVSGEEIPFDPMNQGQTVKPIAKPKLF